MATVVKSALNTLATNGGSSIVPKDIPVDGTGRFILSIGRLVILRNSQKNSRHCEIGSVAVPFPGFDKKTIFES
jgi:hypothetical protein